MTTLHDPAFLEGNSPPGNLFPHRPRTKGRRRSSKKRKSSRSSPNNARNGLPTISFLVRNRPFVCCSSSRDVFRCRAIFALASIKPNLMCMFSVFTPFPSLRCRVDIFFHYDSPLSPETGSVPFSFSLGLFTFFFLKHFLFATLVVVFSSSHGISFPRHSSVGTNSPQVNNRIVLDFSRMQTKLGLNVS